MCGSFVRLAKSRVCLRQFLVTGARLGRGAAASGEAEDAKDADLLVKREGDDASGAHFLGGFLDALAVDPDVALLEDGLSERAAFHQPNEEQEAVDPHWSVIASEAKQSRWAPLDCFVAALLAMTITSS